MSGDSVSAQGALARKVFYDVPAVAGIAGEPGLGKTVDCLYSFPRALFIAARGSLKPAVSVVGHVPLVEYARDVDDIQKLVRAKVTPAAIKSRTITGVVIDDFGAAVGASELDALTRSTDARRVYKDLGIKVRNLIDDFRDLGVHTTLSTHKKSAKNPTAESAGHQGGAGLPGQLMTVVPSITDLWVNMHPDSMRRPWGASYHTGLSMLGAQGTRDRHDVCGERSPPNLGELLRAAGYKLDRPPGLEWQEDLLESITNTVMSGGGTINQAAAFALSTMREKNTPPWAIRWLLRDLVDRVEIRTAIENRRKNAFDFLGITL